MELKKYQKNVINDLARYVELLRQTRDMNEAYRQFWEERGVELGRQGKMPEYQNIIAGVPDVCLKVPTGGGKTFIACCALKTIFDSLPQKRMKAVAWLVPSDAILGQTLTALRDPSHPYRMRLDTDFRGRVEIYTKEELLNGQNLNLPSLMEQLTIMVFSYDSFRGRKEALRARRENSALAAVARALGGSGSPVEDADETSLLQTVNKLQPVVVVDESHHARSTLSKEMLQNFNPSFVLDLTATPTKESNIISYVGAYQLKNEDMVKLPVVVFKRGSQQEVVTDAIDLRNNLERHAAAAERNGGGYIRPIVLFQAQPRTAEESETFEKLRAKLKDAGIPDEEIAIKTAEIDELKDVKLDSRECRIRYIITVNALKEGWDCPFAYILASVANRNSAIDVEQILGRTLRMPYARRSMDNVLNMSYVLINSADFAAALDGIVKGLNAVGFSSADYRVAAGCEVSDEWSGEEAPSRCASPQAEQSSLFNEETDEEETFDGAAVGEELKARESSKNEAKSEEMLNAAKRQDAEYRNAAERIDGRAEEEIAPEVKESMNFFSVNPEFREEINTLRIPQFFTKERESLFVHEDGVLLNEERLSYGFTLRDKPYDLDLANAEKDFAVIDVEKPESTPKVVTANSDDELYIKEVFSKYPPKEKIAACKRMIHDRLNKINSVDSSELRNYIDRIVDGMSRDELSVLEKYPVQCAQKIKDYVDMLLDKHREKTFRSWLETGKIRCVPSFSLPPSISPASSTGAFGKSLYQAEESVNGFEAKMVMMLAGLDNIKWWHRNISRRGFFINGYMNHYPDFIIMTVRGNLVLVETKGDYLDNEESRKKLALGRTWQSECGIKYRYYMVFEQKDVQLNGAIKFTDFRHIIKEL